MGVINIVNLCDVDPCRSLYPCKKRHFKIFLTCKSSQQRYFVCALKGFERRVYSVFTESVGEFHSNFHSSSHLVKIRDLLGGVRSAGRGVFLLRQLKSDHRPARGQEVTCSDGLRLEFTPSCCGADLSVQGCDAFFSN